MFFSIVCWMRSHFQRIKIFAGHLAVSLKKRHLCFNLIFMVLQF